MTQYEEQRQPIPQPQEPQRQPQPPYQQPVVNNVAPPAPVKKKKSYKREVGFALLLFWVILTAQVFWFLDVERIGALEAIYTGLTFILIPTACSLFGFHGVAEKISTNRNA